MTSVLMNALSNVEFLKPKSFKNVSVVGLKTESAYFLDLLTLEKGLDLDLVKVSEIDAEGSVGQLKVINNSVVPLLILDGEELKGAKQNRIVNTTVLIPPNEEFIVPVSCTEQGRWNYVSDTFLDSGNMLSYNARRNKNINMDDSFKSNQSQVWSDISDRGTKLNVNSSTGALSDVYSFKSHDINEYLSNLNYDKGQSGSILFLNGEIVSMELLYNANLYGFYHEKILKSVILEGLDTEDNYDSLSDSSILEYSDEFINHVSDLELNKSEGLGLGFNYSCCDDSFLGSSLFYKHFLVHGLFFNKKFKV